MTPSRPWLGITRPVLADRGRHTSAGGWRQAARGMPGNAAERAGDAARAPGQTGHSGRIGTCVPGRDRAPGSW